MGTISTSDTSELSWCALGVPSCLPMGVTLDQEEDGLLEPEESIQRPRLSSGVLLSQPPGFTPNLLRGGAFSGPSMVTEKTNNSDRTSLMEIALTIGPYLHLMDSTSVNSVIWCPLPFAIGTSSGKFLQRTLAGD